VHDTILIVATVLTPLLLVNCAVAFLYPDDKLMAPGSRFRVHGSKVTNEVNCSPNGFVAGIPYINIVREDSIGSMKTESLW
jgi:hypothetical protein